MDGRITVLAYALGEESFIDQNGDNIWTAGEPFQDLGSLYLDRFYNNVYNQNDDQFIALSLPGATSGACAAVDTVSYPTLALDVTIPSIPSTCDGTWGKAYVRRAAQTVLSTSEANPVWLSAPAGLAAAGASCPNRHLISSYNVNQIPYNADESPNYSNFYPLFGTALYNADGRSYSFLAADANGVRLNPMAAGTTISIVATTGVTATLLGGSPVPSISEASVATFSLSFAPGTPGTPASGTTPAVPGTPGTIAGTVTLTFNSPSGTGTSITLPVFTGAPSTTACP